MRDEKKIQSLKHTEQSIAQNLMDQYPPQWDLDRVFQKTYRAYQKQQRHAARKPWRITGKTLRSWFLGNSTGGTAWRVAAYLGIFAFVVHLGSLPAARSSHEMIDQPLLTVEVHTTQTTTETSLPVTTTKHTASTGSQPSDSQDAAVAVTATTTNGTRVTTDSDAAAVSDDLEPEETTPLAEPPAVQTSTVPVSGTSVSTTAPTTTRPTTTVQTSTTASATTRKQTTTTSHQDLPPVIVTHTTTTQQQFSPSTTTRPPQQTEPVTTTTTTPMVDEPPFPDDPTDPDPPISMEETGRFEITTSAGSNFWTLTFVRNPDAFHETFQHAFVTEDFTIVSERVVNPDYEFAYTSYQIDDLYGQRYIAECHKDAYFSPSFNSSRTWYTADYDIDGRHAFLVYPEDPEDLCYLFWDDGCHIWSLLSQYKDLNQMEALVRCQITF